MFFPTKKTSHCWKTKSFPRLVRISSLFHIVSILKQKYRIKIGALRQTVCVQQTVKIMLRQVILEPILPSCPTYPLLKPNFAKNYTCPPRSTSQDQLRSEMIQGEWVRCTRKWTSWFRKFLHSFFLSHTQYSN